MKRVTLARDMRPWRVGDNPVVQDKVAERLVETGAATNPRPFPPKAAAPAPAKTYRTKGKAS